jgi:hypothetical protein
VSGALNNLSGGKVIVCNRSKVGQLMARKGGWFDFLITRVNVKVSRVPGMCRFGPPTRLWN